LLSATADRFSPDTLLIAAGFSLLARDGRLTAFGLALLRIRLDFAAFGPTSISFTFSF
jgi:hypothetical protein